MAVRTEDFKSRAKPKLPAELLHAGYGDLLRYIVRMLLWYLIPSSICYLAFTSSLPFSLSLPICIFFGWLAGCGLARVQWIGHEASHGSLPPNNFVAMLYSNLLASAMPGYFNISFSSNHLDHHRHTNSPQDPDIEFYSKYNSWFSRLFLVRLARNREYTKLLVPLFKGERLFLNLTVGQVRVLVIANIICVVGWLFFYIWLGLNYPNTFVAFVLFPIVTLVIGTGSLTYQQHGGTGAAGKKDIWRNSRSLSNWVWTFLYSGGNFHLEHHLYPSVPVWNLPKVHRYLKDNGYLDDPNIAIDESGLIGGYRFFDPKYSYPLGVE